MQYYLSLPQGWTPAKAWPILVVADGANHGHFLFNCLRFILARSDRPFIIVAPIILTNSGRPNPAEYPYSPDVWQTAAQGGFASFDEQGVLAVVRDIQREFHGRQKFFITGWSAGGHLTWLMIFAHPDQLAGAAVAGGNYTGRGITMVSTAREREQLPIKAFQGDQDARRQALSEQWQAAKQVAELHGYTNLTLEMVAGGGHAPFAAQVFAYFTNLLQTDTSDQ